MSEPLTTWRPPTEFESDEWRSGGPEAARADAGEAARELIRFAGEGASEHEGADGSDLLISPLAQEPVIRGDFAEIEAALLGAARLDDAASEASELRETPSWARLDLRASREDADAPVIHFPILSADVPEASEPPAPLFSAAREVAFNPGAGALADNFMLFDDAAVSGSAALADEDKRSRRPIYIMAALVLAGVVGITATALRREGGGEAMQQAAKPIAIGPVADAAPAPAAESAAAATAPEVQQPSAADAGHNAQATAAEPASLDPVQQATAAQAAPPPVEAAAAATPQTTTDAAPHVIALNEPAGAPAAPAALPATPAPAALPATPASGELTTSSILAPPPPGKAQELAAPSVKAAIDGAKKVKTAAVRPDGSLVKAEPPATKPATAKSLAKNAVEKAAKLAHLKSAHHATVASAAAAGKTAAGPHAKPAAAVASAAKAKPAQNAQAQPAPIPQTVAAQAPAPAAPTGALAFVDNAVNSVTSATGKLLDWSHTASSGAHN